MFDRETVKKIHTLPIDSSYVSEIAKGFTNQKLSDDEKQVFEKELLAAIADVKDEVASIEKYFKQDKVSPPVKAPSDAVSVLDEVDNT